VLVRPAFVHTGLARELVHRLKYRAEPLPGIGLCLAPLLPTDASALVPVPRVVARRWRYGVDPAAELARSIGAATGLPVIAALGSPIWLHRRAGKRDATRGTPRFEMVTVPPEGAVLVDDVFTTGLTLGAASTASGITTAVTLTAAQR
jgi:predicted amidophosphoribosyltransferase